MYRKTQITSLAWTFKAYQNCTGDVYSLCFWHLIFHFKILSASCLEPTYSDLWYLSSVLQSLWCLNNYSPFFLAANTMHAECIAVPFSLCVLQNRKESFSRLQKVHIIGLTVYESVSHLRRNWELGVFSKSSYGVPRRLSSYSGQMWATFPLSLMWPFLILHFLGYCDLPIGS